MKNLIDTQEFSREELAELSGLRRKDPERERPFGMPGGDRAAVAYASITSLVILAAIVLFVWPEIPKAPEDWAYTGPLLGIVVAAPVAGEAIVWRMFHPGTPRAESTGSAAAKPLGGDVPAPHA